MRQISLKQFRGRVKSRVGQGGAWQFLERRPFKNSRVTRALLSFIVILAMAPDLLAKVRGAWVVTAWNLDWPSRPGLPVGTQKAEAMRLLDVAKEADLTDVYLQVRVEGDAFYRSAFEPWSRNLTGDQGGDPGYDPLAFWISESKKRGLKLHAWINPYRAAVRGGSTLSSNHMARVYSQYAYEVGTSLWMDPGAEEVQGHLLKVVGDLLDRYDIAGIHLDDYFYPYPTAGGGFPDDLVYADYLARGGQAGRSDWRRDNVNNLVRGIHEIVKRARGGPVFSVSPFGIYTKGQPATVQAGLDQLNEIFADPVFWMKQGWVDYLVPQLYWREQSRQSFSELLRWWRGSQANPRRIPVYPGIAADRLGGSYDWPASEILQQVKLALGDGDEAGGYVLFRMRVLKDNTKGIAAVLRDAGY